MRRSLPVVILVALSFFVSGVIAQTGADYYHLGMGNFWVYKKISASDSVVIEEPDRREVAVFQADGKSKVFGVKNEYIKLSGSYHWFKTLPDGEVDMFALGMGADLGQLLMNFDPPLVILPEKPTVGATWEMKMPNSENKLYTAVKLCVESNEETVTVPAGTFRDCLKVKQIAFDENGKESSTALLYYAKGVGEVFIDHIEPESKRYRSELVEYSVKNQ